MDIFQLIGDFLHLLAVLMLILRIIDKKRCSGISYKTQEIYLVVFLTRYVDIFLFEWRSLYLFMMKILFISLTAYTIYLMRFKKPTYISYDQFNDSFQHYFIYLGALVMAIIIHKSLHPMEFIWSFSIWLEAFAILPQLQMIRAVKDIQNITAHYILFLGLYRILYVFHWIWHWEYIVMTSFLAGIIQSLLYSDFIYFFIKANKNEAQIHFDP